MARITFEKTFCSFAKILANRSTCKRLQVGTIITTVDNKKIVGMGYNGNASGLDNDACDHNMIGNCGCLHSEENACINCSYDGHKNVYITIAPCVMCAKRLINLGNIFRVYYIDNYRNNDGLILLTRKGINVEKVDNPSI
jgi:dCMP deaminase